MFIRLRRDRQVNNYIPREGDDRANEFSDLHNGLTAICEVVIDARLGEALKRNFAHMSISRLFAFPLIDSRDVRKKLSIFLVSTSQCARRV